MADDARLMGVSRRGGGAAFFRIGEVAVISLNLHHIRFLREAFSP